MVNLSTPPSLDEHSNPWINFSKNKTIPQILQTKKNKAAPLQVHYQLCCYLRNGGTNFRTQSA